MYILTPRARIHKTRFPQCSFKYTSLYSILGPIQFKTWLRNTGKNTDHGPFFNFFSVTRYTGTHKPIILLTPPHPTYIYVHFTLQPVILTYKVIGNWQCIK